MDKEEEESPSTSSLQNPILQLQQDSTVTTMRDTRQEEEEEKSFDTVVEPQCDLMPELDESRVNEAATDSQCEEDDEVFVVRKEEDELVSRELEMVVEEVGDVIAEDESMTVNPNMGTETEVADTVEERQTLVRDTETVVAEVIENKTVVADVAEEEETVVTEVKLVDIKGSDEQLEMLDTLEETGGLDMDVGDVEIAPKADDKEVVNSGEHVGVTYLVGDKDDRVVVDEDVNKEITNGVNSKEMVDAASNTERADTMQDTEVVNNWEETEVLDAGEDTEVADAGEDTDVADAGEDTEVAEAGEDTGLGYANDDTEVPGMIEDTEVDDAEEYNEVDDAEEYNEVAGVEEDMKVTDMEEDTELVEAEEMEVTDATRETAEAEPLAEGEEVSKRAGGKRKWGKNSKAAGRVLTRKKTEEDVCFICFDGGDLVLCDRRGCPKAYHPSCVNRDEAFFRAKGRWNCGWHLCSNCEKNAYYMCYTCTFSVCKGCVKDAVILCVRKNKGFCETCMKTVMMIERNEQPQVDFDDKSSWEYLFKDYWMDLKQRLSITADEVTQAKNPCKGSNVLSGKEESPDELYDFNNEGGSGLESSGNAEASKRKRRKSKIRTKPSTKGEDPTSSATEVGSDRAYTNDRAAWASNELLEFVMHMRDGDKSILSQFDVQALLLDYIKVNKLRDPRRKSQIICDSRLQNLFGKPRVGHFEMLKLLESHFLVKDDSHADDLQGIVVDTEANQLDADGNFDVINKAGKDKRRKSRRKGGGRRQSNVDDYAAIDTHNINLIYLRRSLLEELIEDTERLHEKVVGAFVRIRISGSSQKQDLYRLVQVVGITKAEKPYKVGKRTTDYLLEILNLNKTEMVSIDVISNQEFTEDECKRLRQSIKCGLINRLSVGDVQEKAMTLQAVRVKDWLESEIMRLSHLRDRASEKGRKKELRECVEKLQLLKTPEERQRRLEEFSEIHADPNMDPSHESDEDETEDKKQEIYMRPRGSSYSTRGRELISPKKLGSVSNDSWSESRNFSPANRELSRNMSNKGLSIKGDAATISGELMNEHSWIQGRERDTQSSSQEKKPIINSSLEAGGRNSNSVVISDSFSGGLSEKLLTPISTGAAVSAPKVSETEKVWHYRDPSGKIQGPFSMAQLRKWNNTGYFPTDLKIWKNTENQDDAILLSNALTGKFQKEQSVVQMVHSPNVLSNAGKSHGTSLQQGIELQGERSNLDQNRAAWNPHGTLGLSGQSAGEGRRAEPEISSLKAQTTDYNRIDSTNLPSPTPVPSTTKGTKGTKGQDSETKWSPKSFPVQPAESGFGGNLHSSTPASTFSQQDSPINKELNAREVLGLIVPAGSNSGRHSVSASENVLATSLPGVGLASVLEEGNLSSSTNTPRMHSQSAMLSELHSVVNAHLLTAPVTSDASRNPSADTASTGATFQNFVQSTTNQQLLSTETHKWGSSSAPNPGTVSSFPIPVNNQGCVSGQSQKVEPNNPIPMPEQPSAYGHWGAAPTSVHNPSPSFNPGNPTQMFPTPGFSGFPSSDPRRPQAPSQQPNMQPPIAPNVPWGMGVMYNSGSAARPGPDTQNNVWGPMSMPMPGNPNMGWGQMLPGNMNWGLPGQGPTPGNVNPAWMAPALGPQSGNTNGQLPGNPNAGWAPTGQGQVPVNANLGWVAPNQGPMLANPNPGWAAPTGNPVIWGNEQNQNGSQGGNSDNAGANHWSQQPSFGSGGGVSSRPHPRGQRVCEYHKNGHCKKGSSCNHIHT